MVGLLDSVDGKMTLDFKQSRDLVFLIGQSRNDIGSSEYLHKICGVEFSPAPHFDLEEEFTMQAKILQLIEAGLLRSAHDVSDGGLLTTLLESCLPNGRGVTVRCADPAIRKDAYWFGEAQSRVVVSIDPSRLAEFRSMMGEHPYSHLGTVTDETITVDGEDWGRIGAWKELYDSAIHRILEEHESEHALTAL
jgi:phosphoribosylformylglycinamidine synthase